MERENEVPIEILSRYSEQYHRPLETLREAYERIYKSITDKAPNIARRIALTKLTNEIKREEGISALTSDYKGIVLGATEAEDINENFRRIALSIHKKDPKRARDEGYVTEDGIVLDRREHVLGRPNPRKGLPLEGEDWRRTLVGLATRTNENNYRFFTLQCFGKKAVDVQVPLNRSVFFRAIEKQAGNERMTLNISEVTRFVSIEESISVEEELRSKNLITPLSEIKEWYEYNKGDRGAVLVTEGSVYRVRREPNEKGRRSITLTDIEYPEIVHPFSVPETVPLDFDEDSRVLVFGKPRYFRNRLWINTIGIYPLPDYLIPIA